MSDYDSYYECFYSNGHDCCTHPHYCIFNENRWELEKAIAKLENQLSELQYARNNLLNGGYHIPSTYNLIKKKIKVIQLDLKELKLIEHKARNKKVNGYGFIQL